MSNDQNAVDWSVTRRTMVMTSVITGFSLAADRAFGQEIKTDTEGLVAGDVKIASDGGDLPAYYAKPVGAGPFPVVLVIEEIFGVHEWIADVCRRLAKAGYLAVAPELYARIADLSKMTDAGQIVRDVISKAPDDQVMRDLDAGAAWAAQNGGDLGRFGVTGFCRGGRAVWLYDAHRPGLKAAVAWYGPMGGQTSPIQPKTALDVAGEIHAPLLGLYGKEDGSIPTALLQQAESKAKAAGKTAEIVVYDGAGHGFAADYRPSYNKAAAMDGWQRMMAWFKQHGVA